jgi:hypothetical protein
MRYLSSLEPFRKTHAKKSVVSVRDPQAACMIEENRAPTRFDLWNLLAAFSSLYHDGL